MKNYTLKLLRTTAALFLLIPPAFAGETPWFETNGGNVRIVTEPIEQGATTLRGMIDIDLFKGWKTYWRDAGSGGIPPSIQLADDINYTLDEIRFPVPVTVKSAYGDHPGYDAPVQIPFSISAAQPLIEGEIEARVMVGICEEICIPAFTDFKFPVTMANGSTRDMLNVRAAFNALPQPPATLGLNVTAQLSGPQELTIEIDGPHDGLQFFISGKNGEQFKPLTIIEQTADKAIFKAEPLRAFKDGQTVDVMLTGQTAKGDFETSQTIKF